MAAGIRARITGTGSYLPERVLSNHELEQMVETSDEWIVTRTGIKERRLAEDDEFTSHMGARAARAALASAGISPGEVDLILVATMSPDYPTPSTAAVIQNLIEANNAAAMDLHAACTGFLYGLSTAKAFVESGMYRNVLLIASEKMSSLIDYTDRNTCVLFGDGASAAVVSHTGKGLWIDTIALGADGALAELAYVPAGGTRLPASQTTVAERQHYFRMAGKEVFKHAVRRMTSAAEECLQLAGVSAKQLAWVVPHQANLRIMDAISKSIDLPSERVFKTVHKYGNTSAASIGIALDELLHAHPVQDGEFLLLLAFGGGLSWGASVLSQLAG